MAVATLVRPGLKCLLLIAALLVLSGCGTISATLADKEGREVMLLGHDPVAYFTLGKPMRGYPNITATHEGKTYYFLKYPGWRAREGYSQPRVGFTREEGAAPATESSVFQGYRTLLQK